MNTHLIELLSTSNILSYSSACIQVHEALSELKEEGFKRVVIPSRGAYPFWNGATSTTYILLGDKLRSVKFNSHWDIWYLPYTSDWEQENIELESKRIRKFWTKILTDTIRGNSSPYTKFYNNTIDIIGERLTVNTGVLKLDKYQGSKLENEKFIFIDTAISGQAISEIIESFNDFNLTDFYIILIVDWDGSKLKSQYKAIIEREKQKGRLVQINVARIFSEDASPLMNGGISSIVFPSLMERAFNEISEFQRNGLIGAGLWFIDSSSHLIDQHPELNGVRGIMADLIRSGLRQNLGIEKEWFTQYTKNCIEQMQKWLSQYQFNLRKGHTTKKLVYDRISSSTNSFDDRVSVSSSHVIRVDIPQDIITRCLKVVR